MAARKQKKGQAPAKKLAVGRTPAPQAKAQDGAVNRHPKKTVQQYASIASRGSTDPTIPLTRVLRKRKGPTDDEEDADHKIRLSSKKPRGEASRSSQRATRSTLPRNKITISKEDRPKSKKQTTKPNKAKAPKQPTKTSSSAAAVDLPRSPPIIVRPPTDPLAILVFGTGDCCELGLGPRQNATPVPLLNPYFDTNEPSAYHVVQFACGGMHTIALTVDNKIVTWGVNDNDALGRNTTWDGGMRDIDDETDDEGELLNPYESTPKEISTKQVPEGTRFAQVAAGDSCSLALTETGLVYGWGTFVDPNGDKKFGIDKDGKIIKKQPIPTLIPNLKAITQIACGANHALALDAEGVVWAWGSGHQNQLGKRLVTRNHNNCNPKRVEIFRNKATYIASGSYHSFALDQNGNVWAWGLNGFGQAGDAETAGENEALLPHPKKIAGLSGKGVHTIDAGSHHSAAVTDDGECLMLGRIDGGQLGIKFTEDQLNDGSHIIRDERDKPRICIRPTLVTSIGHVAHVACGSAHTVFIAKDGKGYASGLGIGGQLGNGEEDDAETPQRFRRVPRLYRGKLMLAGAGGQFSVVAAEAVTKPEP